MNYAPRLQTVRNSLANIVGYIGTDRASQHPGYGAAFVPVAGGDTYKLGEIQVVSEDAEDPFDPDQEFFQVLDPDDTHVIGLYTCLTKQMADLYKEAEEYEYADIIYNNLGWWDYEYGMTVPNVADGKAINRDNVDVHPGDAFLLTSSLSTGRTIKFPAAISEEK